MTAGTPARAMERKGGGVVPPPRPLSALADSTARACWRQHRSQTPPLHAVPADLRTQHEAERARFHEQMRKLRVLVKAREWPAALDLMADLVTFGVAHFCFLEQAFPLMTEAERAHYLRYVWCRSKTRPSPTRSLALFRAATTLRETVPTEWSADVRVYRGKWSSTQGSDPWQRARRLVRHGVAWTTDRAIAMKFATGMFDDVGCLGTTTVSPSLVLAYFTAPDTIEVHGVTVPFDDYHEHECIVDPRTLEHVTYEHVMPTTPTEKDGEP